MAFRSATQRNQQIDTTRVREANTSTSEEKEQSQSPNAEQKDSESLDSQFLLFIHYRFHRRRNLTDDHGWQIRRGTIALLRQTFLHSGFSLGDPTQPTHRHHLSPRSKHEHLRGKRAEPKPQRGTAGLRVNRLPVLRLAMCSRIHSYGLEVLVPRTTSLRPALEAPDVSKECENPESLFVFLSTAGSLEVVVFVSSSGRLVYPEKKSGPPYMERARQGTRGPEADASKPEPRGRRVASACSRS